VLADTHSILNKWKNYFSKSLIVHNVSDISKGPKLKESFFCTVWILVGTQKQVF
jgi:hypothetical protein